MDVEAAEEFPTVRMYTRTVYTVAGISEVSYVVQVPIIVTLEGFVAK